MRFLMRFLTFLLSSQKRFPLPQKNTLFLYDVLDSLALGNSSEKTEEKLEMEKGQDQKQVKRQDRFSLYLLNFELSSRRKESLDSRIFSSSLLANQIVKASEWIASWQGNLRAIGKAGKSSQINQKRPWRVAPQFPIVTSLFETVPDSQSVTANEPGTSPMYLMMMQTVHGSKMPWIRQVIFLTEEKVWLDLKMDLLNLFQKRFRLCLNPLKTHNQRRE